MWEIVSSFSTLDLNPVLMYQSDPISQPSRRLFLSPTANQLTPMGICSHSCVFNALLMPSFPGIQRLWIYRPAKSHNPSLHLCWAGSPWCVGTDLSLWHSERNVSSSSLWSPPFQSPGPRTAFCSPSFSHRCSPLYLACSGLRIPRCQII